MASFSGITFLFFLFAVILLFLSLPYKSEFFTGGIEHIYNKIEQGTIIMCNSVPINKTFICNPYCESFGIRDDGNVGKKFYAIRSYLFSKSWNASNIDNLSFDGCEVNIYNKSLCGGVKTFNISCPVKVYIHNKVASINLIILGDVHG